jgi:hypothetical protein
MIQREMQLHRALLTTKGRPRKELGAQIDHRRIQAQELVVEPKVLAARHRATPIEQLIEDRLIQLPRAVGIRIRERRALRRRDPEVRQLAFATRQPAADLPQRVRAAQLAEQHGDELSPAREAPRMPLRARRDHGPLKIRLRKKLE